MINPFAKFIPELVDAFRKHGERYLVAQTFRAGIDIFTEDKDVLMFSQYNDKGFAQIHLNAIKADKYAAIIDLEYEKHRAKVLEMLQEDSRYLVFSKLLEDKEGLTKLLDKNYAYKLRNYIQKNTNWRISVSSTLTPKLQLIFGELFIVVKFQSQELRVKFQEIGG